MGIGKLPGLLGLLMAAGVVVFFGSKSGKLPNLEQLGVHSHATERRRQTYAGDEHRPVGPEVLRVASWNIQVFGDQKLRQPEVVPVLVDVLRQFDVIAIQEIRSRGQDVLPRLIDELNADGRRYDFCISPRLGRTSSKEQYAFVFDTDMVELDRGSIYTVDDPDDMMHREPFVAGFRARGASPNEAFTFTLVNVHTDPDEVTEELEALSLVFRAVRDDGRMEDDVILLGDFNTDDEHLGPLGRVPGIVTAIYGVASNTRGTKLYDNVIFNQRATTEFTGRGGVVDLIRRYKLTMDEALAISDHLPVWAEFSVYEGGDSGRFAEQGDRERYR